MNVSQTKTPTPRIEIADVTNLEIIGYGNDNLYPQRIKDLIACSETGEGCLKRYVDFIQGNGFNDEAFAKLVVNTNGDTADDILQQIADDLGSYGGFALHVNYNLLGDIVELYHIPFESCRLGQEDDLGYIGKIAVHPDWSGKRKRNGKPLKPTKETIDYISVFNPNKSVVLAQIEASDGIDTYKGQILWVSSAGKQEYPKTIYDKVVSQMSTEEGLGNIALRNVRNNFTPGGMLITKKGQDIPQGANDNLSDDDTINARRNSYEDDSIASVISDVQGDENANKIIHFEVEYDEEIPQFVPFQGANYDKDFTVTSDTVCEKIYAAFGQEAWHRVRKGSVGFSSDIMRDTYDVYNSVTNGERRTIERVFDKVFKRWYTSLPTSDFSIEPLTYISSEPKQEEAITEHQEITTPSIEAKVLSKQEQSFLRRILNKLFNNHE